MKSIYEIHKDIVELLKYRGEPIFCPTDRKFLVKDRTLLPDVYVKGREFPSEDFVAGFAIEEEDGTYMILHDDKSLYIGRGFKIEELGLCDPAVWYENQKYVEELKQKDLAWVGAIETE